MKYINFETTIYAISNLFRIYVMSRYSQICFERKDKNRILLIAAYTGYFLINTFMHIVYQNTWICLITNIIPYFIITFLYDTKLVNRLISVISIYAISMFWDGVLNAVAQVLSIDSLIFSSGIATSLMVFLSVLILERFIIYKQNPKIQIPHLIAILTIPIGSIIIGTFTMQPYQFEEYPQSIIIECIILLLINGMVFVLYDILGKVYQQQSEKIIYREQSNAFQHQIRIMNQSQKQIRFLKHDMHNHLAQIQALARQNKLQQIIEYVDAAFSFVEVDKNFADSGNPEIDSILNLKLAEADAMGTKIKINLSVPNELDIPIFDLNIILGNLLDNAIAALENCKEKRLFVKMTYEANILYITIKNSYMPAMQHYCKRSGEHGLGLPNVCELIKKYYGQLQSEKSEQVYTVNLMLTIKKV